MAISSREALRRFDEEHNVEPEGLFHTALAVFFGAAAIVLSFAPTSWIPVAFIGIVPVLSVTRGATDAQVFRRALAFGFLMNLGGFPWVAKLVADFGGFPFAVGVLLLALLCVHHGLVPALAFWVARKVERALGWRHGYALPMTWVAAEFLVPIIFPWRLGHSQVFHLNYLQLAELGGVHLMSFGVVLINVGVYDAIRSARAGELRSVWQLPRIAWLSIGFLVFAELYGAARVRQVEASESELPTLKVALIEGDIPIDEKWDSSLFHRNLILYQKLSVEAEEQGAELIIWPESSYELGDFVYIGADSDELQSSTVLHHDVRQFPQSTAPFGLTEFGLPKVDRVAPQRNFTTPLLTGTTTYRDTTPEELLTLPPISRDVPRRHLFFNSVVMMDEEGVVEGVVDKVVLMPLSETFPGGVWIYDTFGFNVFEVLRTVGLFGSGDGPAVMRHKVDPALESSGVLRVGILNCYEDLMPGFVRTMQRNHAPHFMVNLTNDAWFGREMAPSQHMALAVPRAVEARTWLLRATNTGVSTFVDASGRVLQRSSVYDPEILLHDVRLKPASRTPYVAFGEWVATLCISFSAIGLFRRYRQRKETGR